MIYYSIPFDDTKNIGVYYNRFMNLLGEDDWACFLDGDAMFLHPFFGIQLQEYIDLNPDCGLFTAKTNRIGNTLQKDPTVQGDDIRQHRQHAEALLSTTSTTRLNEHGQDLSGVLILVSKAVWGEIGGFRENGMLGVDSDFCQRAKRKNLPILVMDGVYVYHWYRGGGTDKSHLL